MKTFGAREHLLASTVFASFAALAMPAFAQEADASSTEARREQAVVVTGSRIVRTDLENNTPTLLLSAERLQVQGLENLADITTALPQFAPSFGAARTQSTFSGAPSSGLNLANLRNLGTSRSVVLINGRRVQSGTPTGTSVDFNTIPSANIERVEVLTGGASAVYGADAIAGVVNIITKQDFEGVQLGLSYGEAFDTKDNQNPNGYLMVGARLDDDRGRFLFTAQYDYQGFVSCADRFLCAEDFFWSPPAAPLRGLAAGANSGVNPAGRFFIDTVAGSFTARNGSFTDASGALIPFAQTVDAYNRNRNRTLAIPTERVMFAFQADYRVNDFVEVFTELNVGSSETIAPFEGHPFQSNNDRIGGVLEPTIPVSNPFVPAALRARAIQAGDSEITWWQRFDGFGLRGATNRRDSTRAVIGLRGDLPEIGIGSDWTWEAFYIYGRTALDSTTNGLVSRQNLFNGLRVEADPGRPGQFRCVDPVARSQGCVPINPFAPYTQDQINYLTVTAGQRGVHELENGQAFITGTLMELPAGPLQVAFGLETRRISGFLDYDDPINRGITTGNQIGDVLPATVATNEGYVEAIVPLLADRAWAKSLSVEGAYRLSNTDGLGEYDTWKFGGEYAPVDSLRFRAMYGKSVKAPEPGSLSGVSQTFGVVNDPCTAARRNANPTRAANCLADGVPANYAPPITVEQGVSGSVGGNPNLGLEEAKTLTYGFVFTPPFLDNFTLTLDRFEIDLTGTVNTVGRQLKANRCYDTTERQFCGDLLRGTNPSVPGATWVLREVNDQLVNVGGYDVRGFDIEARYNFDLANLFRSDANWGNVQLGVVGTIYDKVLFTALPGVTPVDMKGFAGGSTSDQGWLEQQYTFTTGYSIGDFQATLVSRWIPETGMTPFNTALPKIPGAVYHSLQGRYDITGWAQVYAGVSNLTDKEPPFFASGTAGTQALDTVPGYYDIFGRQWYAGVTLKF